MSSVAIAIGALMAAHSVCRKQLIATTYQLPSDVPQTHPFMQMPEGAGDGISWWMPNRPCLIQWLKAAGFSRYELDATVKLTVDSPYTNSAGQSSACNQVQQCIHAFA
jgi:hypothetical protein